MGLCGRTGSRPLVPDRPGHRDDFEPSPAAPKRPSRLRAWIVPAIRSEHSAISALIVGFLLEAATEAYQFVGNVGWIGSNPVAYGASLAATMVGFYFFWRGFYEWNRVRPRGDRATAVPRLVPIGMLVGGIGATAMLNVGLGTVGNGGTPAPLAWLVGGAFVWAVGSFFLTLERRIDPFVGPVARGLAFCAWAWSLGISVVAGLVLGQEIVGLFVYFFTNWSELILALAPFVFVVSPLYVAFALIAAVYLIGRRAAPRAPTDQSSAPVGIA